MFENKLYKTKGIAENLSLVFQALLWKMIENMEIQKDYLQVFKIQSTSKETTITHSQEQPPCQKVYTFPFSANFTGKIYVIDDGEYSTMLLAEEY